MFRLQGLGLLRDDDRQTQTWTSDSPGPDLDRLHRSPEPGHQSPGHRPYRPPPPRSGSELTKEPTTSATTGSQGPANGHVVPWSQKAQGIAPSAEAWGCKSVPASGKASSAQFQPKLTLQRNCVEGRHKLRLHSFAAIAEKRRFGMLNMLR